MTTKTGLDDFMVLAVVRGSIFMPMSPEIQEIVTTTALGQMSRWSCSEPLPISGISIREDNTETANNTHITPFRFKDCFLAASYAPRKRAENRVVHSHITIQS